MKLKEQTIIEVQGDNDFEKIESTINEKKLKKLYGILSNLYRNIYGSIIREYASNAWDSHKEAGREDEPIIIKLQDLGSNSYLEIKDVGLGMSTDIMRDVYFNYLDSTKEDTDDLIGAYGIGSKSALAYTHTFYVTTVHNGIESAYIFAKQASGIPAGELIMTKPTDAHNGVTVKIPIKQNDISAFYNELNKQLVYFPNVYVDTNYSPRRTYYSTPTTFKNDYTIYDTPLYKYRPDIEINELHIALGDVPYTIDWTELGMKSIDIPIALKFTIGELIPTPSRESITYTKESIRIIKDKIKLFIDTITEEYNKTVDDVTTIEEYVSFKKHKDFISHPVTKGEYIVINKSILPGLKHPTIQCIKSLPIKAKVIVNKCLIDYKLSNIALTANGSRQQLQRAPYGNGDNDLEIVNKLDKYSRCYILKGTTETKKNRWLAHVNGGTIYFLVKNKPSLKSYIRGLGLKKKDKAQWREIITTVQKLTKEFIENKFKCYDDLVIDPTWIKNEEVERKLRLAEIFTKRKEDKSIVYHRLKKGYNKDYVWDKTEDKISNICNISKNIIYAETKSKGIVDDLYNHLRRRNINKKYWSVITTAKAFHKHFEEKEHMMSYQQMLKDKHPILVAIATGIEVRKILPDSTLKFYYRTYFKYINKDIFDKAVMLSDYCDEHIKSTWGNMMESYNLINKAVKDLDALDENVINAAQDVAEFIKELKHIHDYLTPVNDRSNHSSYVYEHLKAYATVLRRVFKKPINKGWYLKDEFNPVWIELEKPRLDKLKKEEDARKEKEVQGANPV